MAADVFPSQFKKDMAKFQQAYLQRLQEHFEELVKFQELLAAGAALPKTDIQRLTRLSHNFSGSGATFGFPQISRTAHALQDTLRKFQDGQPDIPALSVALRSFEDACRDAVNTAPAIAADHLVLPAAPALHLDIGSSDIYIFARKPGQGDALAEQMRYFGYNVVFTEDTDAVRDAMQAGHMKALVVYSELSPPDIGIVSAFIAPLPRHVPVIMMGDFGDMEAYLAAVRLGARGYFTAPADPLRVIDKIEQVVAKYKAAPRYNVLIVDDDRMLAEFYTQTLQRAGMVATTLANPKDTLDFLSNNQADLVFLDFSMPGCNGQELASVIRLHDEYVSLPIVFISSQEDLKDALQKTGLGVDDFLLKPFTADQLLAVANSRAQRAAELKALMIRDGFTGLLNHVRFNEELALERLRVERQKTDSVYAMVDIDHFKTVNDTHGHAVGDKVIKGLSRMLQQQMRRTDVIGRCGGEEFGIIMPGCDLENARQVLEKLRKKFAESPFTVGDKKINITLSCGYGKIDAGLSVDALIKKVDKSLYEAKHQGRNRIIGA